MPYPIIVPFSVQKLTLKHNCFLMPRAVNKPGAKNVSSSKIVTVQRLGHEQQRNFADRCADQTTTSGYDLLGDRNSGTLRIVRLLDPVKSAIGSLNLTWR